MNEEQFSVSEQYSRTIKLVAAEHVGHAICNNNDYVSVDSSNPVLIQSSNITPTKTTPKKTLALNCNTSDSKGAKRKGKMLALDMSQVTTSLTSELDDDEPRSCDVAIQSSYADNQCSKVTEFLFVGSENVAKQKDLLLEKGITHVVNCSGTTSPNFFEDIFKYKTLKLNDSPKEDVLQLFREVVAFITEAVENGGKVFIHCQRGVSRGPTIALSYLMWERGLTYEEAYPLMKQARAVCCPNPGFVFQLLEWEHQCKLLSPSPGGYNNNNRNRTAEFTLQSCKTADIRLVSADKVTCS